MNLPSLPPKIPTRDYGPLRTLGRGWLRLSGWKIQGELPDAPRLVVAVAPHSSNWDFVQVAAAIFALRLRVAFIGKHTLFRGPLGRFMRWMGGIPVDRSRPEGAVQAAADALRAAEGMWLGVAPEGTRKRGARFKSGFYRIARAAGAPILPISIDHRHRLIVVHAPLPAGDDVEAGVEAVRQRLLSRGARREDRSAKR